MASENALIDDNFEKTLLATSGSAEIKRVLVDESTGGLLITQIGKILEDNSHLLREMVEQQKITNKHLSLVTSEEISDEDIK